MLGATACADVLPATDAAVATSDLLFLAEQGSAPAPGATTFWVYNARLTVQTLRHADGFNTAFLELRFPAGTLSSLNGKALTTADSVRVTAEPSAGEYGVTLSPSGLVFAADATPSLTFSYARYGDASVADGSTRYASRSAYAAALDVWQQTSSGRWVVAKGSSLAGSDGAGAAIDAPGTYAVAALR